MIYKIKEIHILLLKSKIKDVKYYFNKHLILYYVGWIVIFILLNEWWKGYLLKDTE